jgi:hypothetical protein
MERNPMRIHHVIVIIAIAILAIGARLFLFPPKSEAFSEAFSSDAGLNIQEVRKNVNMQKLPNRKVDDMSLVFDRMN